MHMLNTPCSGQHDNMPESPCLDLPASLVAAPPQEKSCSWVCCFLIQNNQSRVYTPQPSPLLDSHSLDHFTLVLIMPESSIRQPGTDFMPQSLLILSKKANTTLVYPALLSAEIEQRYCTSQISTMLTQGIHGVSPPPGSKMCTILGSEHIINYVFNHICPWL